MATPTSPTGIRPSAAVAAGDGGWFGRWEVDPDGTPSFVVDPVVADDALVLPGSPAPGPGATADHRDVWHGVGNAGITALAHAGGWSSLWTADRGMVRLTDRSSWWGVQGQPTTEVTARWLPGAVVWTASCGPARVVRRMAAHPDGLPVLRIDVEITGGPGATWEERWVPAPLPLLVGGLMSPLEPPPPDLDPGQRPLWWATFAAADASRRLTGAVRRRLGPWLTRTPTWSASLPGMVVPPRWPRAGRPAARPAWIDLSLPELFVAALDEPDGGGIRWDGTSVLIDLPERPPRRPDEDVPFDALAAVLPERGRWHVGEGERHEVDDPSAHVVRLAFAVGLAESEAERRRLVGAARAATSAATTAAWGALLDLTVDEPGTATWLPRESRWHAAALVGAEQHDDHLGGRYVSQGSAYAFVHGLQGAPRDEALFSVPLALLDPMAAREQLEVLLRMTAPDGVVGYAHTGRGMATSAGIHAAPTDLPLWVLWAATEHVWATGDAGVLDAIVPWRPAGAAPAATGRDHLAATARHLLHGVGRGPHGLLRVGSGDWADPISAMVPDRAAFHRHGESTFNTGFACYVLPRAADLLADGHPELAEELRATAAELGVALEAAWTGRWWLRGFDGRGGPLGADHLFVDGQVWPLIAEVGPRARRERVVEEIAARCDDPSPIGATILDRPHPVRLGMLAPGWDCNGGVWAAVNALLAWAYATVDPARAWASLRSQSLAAHAAAYPDVWYGIWSGPDAYNAWFGSRPGETFVQPATPMREFPVLNANAHAGPLLALLRVLGIETTPDGLVVRDRGGAVPPWRLRTASGLDLTGGG